MNASSDKFDLPRNLDDVDKHFMTRLLQRRGIIAETNSVVDTEESDVGMTAGYFSAIKRVRCIYDQPIDGPDTFIVKAWPEFELAPGEDIADMFAKDIKGYMVDDRRFYPRPKALLADYDKEADLWALVMEDVCTFGDQQLHENEMGVEDVLRMIPRLVDLAVEWEGCDTGEKHAEIMELGAFHWASDENLSGFRQLMPGGARLWDYLLTSADTNLAPPDWRANHGEDFIELFARKLDAWFKSVSPENGGTCTLSHGDLRGDNLFFCEPSKDYPHGWLAIDFQLMFQGPVASDIAYLMNSGSVLPEVYQGENRERILRTFYDSFMAKTKAYPDYSWEQFLNEYAVMSAVLFVFYSSFGAAINQAALNDEQPTRVELGTKGETEADLAPDELRKRMWWTKTWANFNTTFRDFNARERLLELPDNTTPMGDWFDLPERLKQA